MAAVTDYATLCDEIDNWDERSHDSDQLIGLSEAVFRLQLGPNYARETTSTVTITSGSGPLPTGFIRPVTMVHATYGEIDLKSIQEVLERRVWDSSGIPDIYAVTGTTVETAPTFTGSLSFTHEAKFTGLSQTNSTNWLITNAPQVYLSMCLSFAKAYSEDYNAAATLRASALNDLDALGRQSQLAASRGYRIAGATP